ncbi:MAG TPA: PEGA domain-containing protein [Myxococcota bacterium]|nr:PEGA domain-containing protein [Myxococcota bacterium]
MHRLIVMLFLAALVAPLAAAQEDEPTEPAESTDNTGDQAVPVEKTGKTLVILFDTQAAQGVDASEAASARAVIENSLSSGEVEVVDAARLVARREEQTPDDVRKDLSRARALTKQGRERLLELALDDAIDSFLSARVILRRRMQWLDDPGTLIDALMGLAESLAAAGRGDDARSAYREILVVAPNYVPDPGQVPGKFRALFDTAAEMSKDVNGSISVNTDPQGALAELDGLKIGRTPTTKKGVPDGLHSLYLSKTGYRAVRKIVEVSAGESAKIEEKLSPQILSRLIADIQQEIAGPGSQEKLSSSARDLAHISGAGAVVLSQLGLNIAGKKVLTIAVIPANGDTARIVGLPLGTGGAVELGPELAGRLSEALSSRGSKALPPDSLGMDFSARLLGESAKEKLATSSLVRLQKKPKIGLNVSGGTQPPAPVAVQDSAGGSIFTRWWFWTGVGAVAAAIVGTSLALTLGGGEDTINDPDLIHIQLERIGP